MGTSKVEPMVDRRRVEVEDQAARADAFRALADRHLDASYRLAQVILGQRAEAEDATHDAFVTAWRKWSTLRDPESWPRRAGRRGSICSTSTMTISRSMSWITLEV